MSYANRIRTFKKERRARGLARLHGQRTLRELIRQKGSRTQLERGSFENFKIPSGPNPRIEHALWGQSFGGIAVLLLGQGNGCFTTP
jgi:hypothetical protein